LPAPPAVAIVVAMIRVDFIADTLLRPLLAGLPGLLLRLAR
jgi:hypothetical protein